LGFLSFFIIPEIILGLFLIGSGYHFGQEHFEKYDLPDSLSKVAFMSFYGLSIILCILYVNYEESVTILNDLIFIEITEELLLFSLIVTSICTLLLGIITLKKLKWSMIARESLYLVVLYIIFVNSSLIWSFAIYFVLWHSIPSIYTQIEHLHGETNWNTTRKYLKSSLWYWVAALLFLGVLYYFLHLDEKLFLTILVAFLGGITFPHVIVMNRLHG
jgi:Brp/Blh family beta-carotene 15,15'-monooxygenase